MFTAIGPRGMRSPAPAVRFTSQGAARAFTLALAFAATLGAAPSAKLDAQRPTLASSVRQFVAVDTAVVALTNARVIDGTGNPARESQTLILRDGMIAAMGSTASTPVPSGALVLDLTGKSVIPGLVRLHEHLYYPTGGGTYANLSESFARLYLAGGVTAMRTGGNTNGYGEISMRDAIARGEKAGPWVDATAPYLQMRGLSIGQMYNLKDPADARRMVNFWADAGATSFKAYMHISRDVLSAAIDEVHKRGLKITGHLCSVTLREAAALGIDNVVALTSTLAVFETFTPGRPLPPGLEVLTPQLKELYEARYANTQRNATHSRRTRRSIRARRRSKSRSRVRVACSWPAPIPRAVAA